MKGKILIMSLLINLILISYLAHVANRKGGIRFIKRKMGIGQVNSDNGFGPYYDQRRSLFEVLPRDTSDIIFVGHSLIDGCEWADLFNNPYIKNRGINGELTEGIIKRMDVLTMPPPKKIFLMMGANDIGSKIPLNQIFANCRTILNSFKLRCPSTRIHLISVMPVGRTYDKDIGPVIIEFNKGLQKLTREFGYTYIDLFSLVKDDEGYFDEAISNDGSHLMGNGYLRLKDKLKEYLE